ncbi:MAG: MurR/RpiR family transcriptional regulator, partial [Brachybacterium sp.]|nr:MurR/RpiR family transcriptional regulator [Brachybacterium sp.]
MTPEPPASSRPALQTLRDCLAELTPTMRRVAEEILADPLAAGSTSITALAQRAGVNAATVSRLATRLGYSGFPALRSPIGQENARNAQSAW